MSAYGKPEPAATPETAPFWEGCRAHELRLQRCDRCGKFWFPPGVCCPHCLATEWAWTKVSGNGKVHSYVVYHRVYHPGFAGDVPYVVALVELDEGPRMLSNIVGCAPGDVRCEMRVRVVFEDVTERTTLPKFRPAEAGTP